MSQLQVGNAPCSWGLLEFEEAKSAEPITFDRMLDELAAAGYTGTELGDWGFMPTNPAALRSELSSRNLQMLGAFVPVDLADPNAHDAGIAEAVKTASLLAASAGSTQPFLVLADANGTDRERTRLAGRIQPEDGLTASQWKTFAAGADHIARAVLDATGLRTVFHHHCAGYVETPDEISTLLDRTDPSLLGLVFDTGHFTYGAGTKGADMFAFLDKHASRVWYIHCKDCEPDIAARARNDHADYFAALRMGVFCELGKGSVDFPRLLRWLAAQNYNRYVLVEQDVLPGMGAPADSARRNREYLRSIESNFA